MMAAFARFFTERVFGPGRAAMLAATLPASTAAADQRRQQRAAALRKKLAKIDVSERALVTELETPIDPADAAAQALRNRVRARFTELYTERTGIESELATLETAPVDEDDPTGRTPRPRGHPHRRPRRTHRTAARRLRHQSHLQPRQTPGHHPRHHHRHHPPGRHRPAYRPPAPTTTSSQHQSPHPKIMLPI